MIKLNKFICYFLFTICVACSKPEPLATQNSSNNHIDNTNQTPQPTFHETKKTHVLPKIILQTDATTGKLSHCQANLDAQSGEKLKHIISATIDQPICQIQTIELSDHLTNHWLHDENFYQLFINMLNIKGLTLAINETNMIKGLVQAKLIHEPPIDQAFMMITVEDDTELLKLRKILQSSIKNLKNIHIYITPNKKISQYINEQNANISKLLKNEQATVTEMQQALKIQVINFGLGSHELPPFNTDVLTKLATWLQKNPHIQLQITGFTDNTGDENYNINLSKMRAETIQQFLVNKGVDQQRIQTFGKGSDSPIADNDSEIGRFKNRRIEFVLTEN